MNIALRPDWTLEQFLAWERQQEARHEFDGRTIIEMNGGTLLHDRIRRRLTRLLEDLAQNRAEVWGPDVQVLTGRGVRYPDVVVTASPQQIGSRQLIDPLVIFEVLSDSTEQTDFTAKLSEYMHLPSVQRYIMLSQREVLAFVVLRSDDGWLVREQRDGDLDLPGINAKLSLTRIYEGVALS